MESLPENYKVGNKAFLQALIARGAVTFEEARPVIAAIVNADNEGEDAAKLRGRDIDEQTFMQYLDTARDVVSLFDYDIRTTLHQISKERIYALVNTTSDPQTQLASIFAPDELSFIKRIFDAMFETYNTPRMEVMAVRSMDAVKLSRPPNRRESQMHEEVEEEAEAEAEAEAEGSTQPPVDRGLKHSEATAVLTSLVDAGWLEQSRAKYYSLSPRGLLELRPWLLETYNDPDAGPDEWQRIKRCAACKDLITYGKRCAEPDCTLRLHDICEDAYWRTAAEQKCQKCGRQWTGDKYVGERAATQTAAAQRRRNIGANSTGRRRDTLQDEVLSQRQRDREEEEEEDDGENIDTEEEE